MRRTILLIALIAAVACSKERDDFPSKGDVKSSSPSSTTAPAQTSTRWSTPTSAAAPAPAGTTVITAADGSTALAVRDAGGGTLEIDVTSGGRTQHLRGTSRDSGKRKYTLDNGPVFLEVKPHEEGFKVRDPNGTLRWKVKIDGDKVKVSDNEQNANPFVLKNGKVLDANEQELGRVQDGQVTGANKSIVYRFTAPTTAPGVLLMAKIPAQQQAVIIAELLSRKR
jgi:hypothetical protein